MPNRQPPTGSLLRLINNTSNTENTPTTLSASDNDHPTYSSSSHQAAIPSPSSCDIESQPLVRNVSSFDDLDTWSDDGSPSNRQIVAARKIKSWFAESLIVSILGACCLCALPVSLCGLYHASQVDASLTRGSTRRAAYYAHTARLLTITGATIAGVSWILGTIVFIVLIAPSLYFVMPRNRLYTSIASVVRQSSNGKDASQAAALREVIGRYQVHNFSLIRDSFDDLDAEILKASTDEIVNRTKLLENDVKVMKSEQARLTHEHAAQKEKIKDNKEKIKLNKQLPYLVANVVELLDMDPADEPEEDGANIDLDAHRKGKCAVVKTSTRQTIFLPMIGLVEVDKIKPGDLVGVNKDSYLVLDTLPAEYDSRVKAMEVDEKPTEDYNDVGGLDKQIEELVEAIVLPMTHADKFKNLGIKPPKGVLMYGPPGTGKTLLARACAAQTNSTFLKLAGPQLVQMFIGDGAKLVRDAFNLAKEKSPAIIFIDELDAIGTKRFDSEKSGDREVQRTMLELLNQLDGFSSDDRIKVIAATNRIDILDPALLRSGRLDRKIEFPLPTEEGRARIMQIHSRKMTVAADVNFEELARSCDEFNGAQCKAVCVEAGMIALRRGASEIQHEDFMEGIQEVQAKKKTSLVYFA
ncbi:hypothetical protein SeMB42_g01681 [Synchytrium endobioticum]|uniref:26S proteasome regulatory subunit 6A n=1 Tax=Synchytrium endobioticum TaxID=286115 RepID=A0A507DK64_9FUNG|nr:hypothetical protein SeMB42_g01681 [Synchytrium endobioticum]